MRTSAGFLVLLVFSSPALATGTFDAGPVTIYIDNGRTTECIETHSGLCAASSRGNNDAEREVDTYQELRSIVVVVDTDGIETLLNVAVLPDAAVVYDASGIFVPIPVFLLAAEHVGTIRGPGETSDIGLVAEDWGFGAYWVWPSEDEPTRLEPRGQVFAYSDDGGVTNEGVGPFYGTEPFTTDDLVNDSAYIACDVTDAPDCGPTTRIAEGTWFSTAPNVTAGAAIYRAEAGNDPDLLTPSTGTAPDGITTPLPPRSHTPPPMPGAPFADPAARPAPGTPGGPSPAQGGPHSTEPRSAPPTDPVALAAQVTALPPVLDPAALVAISAGLALTVILAALYSRITKREDALRQGRRREILEVLERAGPQSIRALGLALGVDRKTAQHHARVLQRTNTVLLREVGRTTVVALPHQDAASAEVVGPSRAECALLDVIAESGGKLPRRELHALTSGMPVRTRNHAIRALIDKERVVREWDGWVEVIRLAGSASAV